MVSNAPQRTMISDSDIQSLDNTLRGPLVQPTDRDYAEVCQVWNGMIDKRPALIARCLGTADIVAALQFAREHDLRIAVRGAGHNVAGNALCDDGLVIDLSLMKGIHVDPKDQSARVQPGANWGDVDRETQRVGLATPGGQVSTTGISGFTLAGGIGFLRRKWGLACDNLKSVEVVTATGEVLTACESDHPDLFWAFAVVVATLVSSAHSSSSFTHSVPRSLVRPWSILESRPPSFCDDGATISLRPRTKSPATHFFGACHLCRWYPKNCIGHR